jgi:hypothetical protein
MQLQMHLSGRRQEEQEALSRGDTLACIAAAKEGLS